MNLVSSAPAVDRVEHLRRPIVQEMAKQMYESIRSEMPSCSNLSIPDFFRMLARRHDAMFDIAEHKRIDTSVDDLAMCRAATSSAQITETFSTVIGNAMLEASAAEPDSTRGWVQETTAINFLVGTAFTLEESARLEKLPKGTKAVSTSFGTKGQSWGIARYAGSFTVDEKDIVDGQYVGAVLLAAKQHGAAAARVRPDLIYALLLSNPTLSADNLALFHTSHNNKATGGGSVLGAMSLDSAISGIGMQHLVDMQETGDPIHSNLQAKFLIVPPKLVGPGRRIVRDMVLGDGNDIEVRQESRLSTLGIVDPNSNTAISNSAGDTNWLLCANSSSRPSIMVGGLNGNLQPTVRNYQLDKGQWGLVWDSVLDIGAAAIDYRGVYYSVGA